jgi:hypothetical protein
LVDENRGGPATLVAEDPVASGMSYKAADPDEDWSSGPALMAVTTEAIQWRRPDVATWRQRPEAATRWWRRSDAAPNGSRDRTQL